jgi:hypothetical protein
MAVIMAISTEAAGPVVPTRGRPRKLFRGVIRTLIRKTLAKMNAIRNNDMRAIARGALLQYNPATVSMSSVAADRNAFDRVISRLQKCLLLLEGDE